MTAAPVLIRGALRDYDWGRRDGLVRWSATATSGPQAELWYGCHPAAPSPLADADGQTLADVWGHGAAPILVKLLAAATPLSLQVHPEAALVAQWLRDPEAADLLSDPVEKTELLLALEPFTVLAGWRPFADSARILAAVGAHRQVVEAAAAGDPGAAVRLLLTDHQVHVDADAWTRALAAAGVDDVAAPAMTAVVARFGGDAGVAVAAMLASCELQPYDAVYVPAGVPHAYVAGLGVEIMTSSDNVLRMGLTSKRISVEHTLAALVPDRAPTIIRAPGDRRYTPAGAPFAVAVAQHGEVTANSASYRLILAVDGDCEVAVGEKTYSVPEGAALAVPPNARSARVASAGSAVVVSSSEEVA